MCSFLRPISSTYTSYPAEVAVATRRLSLEKISRICLGILSASATILSAVGFAVSGNPVALVSTFVFGYVTLMLLDTSEPRSVYRAPAHYAPVPVYSPPSSSGFGLGYTVGSLVGRASSAPATGYSTPAVIMQQQTPPQQVFNQFTAPAFDSTLRAPVGIRLSDFSQIVGNPSDPNARARVGRK